MPPFHKHQQIKKFVEVGKPKTFYAPPKGK